MEWVEDGDVGVVRPLFFCEWGEGDLVSYPKRCGVYSFGVVVAWDRTSVLLDCGCGDVRRVSRDGVVVQYRKGEWEGGRESGELREHDSRRVEAGDGKDTCGEIGEGEGEESGGENEEGEWC